MQKFEVGGWVWIKRRENKKEVLVRDISAMEEEDKHINNKDGKARRESEQINNEDEENISSKEEHQNTDDRASVQESVDETELIPSHVGLVCARNSGVSHRGRLHGLVKGLGRTYVQRHRRMFCPHSRNCMAAVV